MPQGVRPQQTPPQVLQSAAQLAPQLQVPNIPNPQPVPADQSAAGISGVLTPQFADALSAQAMTGHPGQNGLSAVLGSLVSAHQQIDAGNAKNASSRASNRKSLMKQAKDAVDAQLAVEKVQQNSAKALLQDKTSNRAINTQQKATDNARLDAQDAATSRVTAATISATSRAAAAASTAHAQILKHSTESIKLAQSQLKGAQAHLLKVTKPVLDISGNPTPPTPDQTEIITIAQREVAAVKHRVAVATVRADVVQAISGVAEYGMVGGVDISNTPQFRTLPTASWDKSGQQLVTVLYSTPNFARFAVTDVASGTVLVRDVNPSVPNGAAVMYKLASISSLGIHFDKSVVVQQAPLVDITPTPLPTFLQGVNGTQLHDQLTAPAKTSLLNGRY